ncbi:HIT-like domain-containing protein [Crassisporium funariophilum]|nr:HIT-like domain-containing protein [Crassisporium funariophilum]
MASNLDEKCLFCLIVQGVVPSFKVFENEHSLAFLDISPVSEGHTQVIPKYHAPTIADLPDEYLRDIGPVLKKVAHAAGVEAFNVLQNNGKLAFQHVGHVHFHVIPKPNETEGIVFTPEAWPMKAADKEDLAKTAERMRARM